MSNSVGMFSIGGLASGLDTSNMIEQLMQLERLPVRRMENTQASLRKIDDAWKQINTKLSSLRTAIDAISRPDRFQSMLAVTSSNADAVSVTRGTGSTTGSLTFTATQLASAHQVASGDFASAGDPLGAGTFSVAVGDGAPVEIELTAEDTLTDLARKLNGAKGGFTASVVKVDDTTHRLVISGAATGKDKALTVTSDLPQFGATELRTIRAAQDALVQIGDDPQFVVSRSSNTIGDLVPGASVTLRKTGEEVTITSSRDTDAAVKAVKSYVDALNGAIKTLQDLSGYDAAAKKGGVLQGDATARRLLGQLRDGVTAATGLDRTGLHSAYQVGLAVDRNGAVTLDEAKLKAALADDFDAVGRLFARTATTTEPLASSAAGTSATKPGTYAVEVSKAADVARATGALFTPEGQAEPKTFRVTAGGKAATVTLDTSTMTKADVLAAIEAALEQAAISSLSVSFDDTDQLVIGTNRYGSAAAFSVEELTGPEGEVDPTGTAYGLAGAHSGVDVEGTIGGIAAVGSGQVLTGASGDATGLSVTWTGDGPSDAPFDVTFSRGLAGAMGDVLRTAEGSGGSVARARKGIASRIDIFQTRIDQFDVRLATRESTLRRQFTAMETALSQLNAQGNWLAGQLSGLNALNQQQR